MYLQLYLERLRETKEIKMNINLNINKDGLSDKEVDKVVDMFQTLDREDIVAIVEGTQITIGGDVKVQFKRQYK